MLKNVNIELLVSPKLLTLKVEDDGIGLPNPIPKSGGLGFRNIRERMSIYGGDVTLSRPASGGTRIDISLPLTKKSSLE